MARGYITQLLIQAGVHCGCFRSSMKVHQLTVEQALASLESRAAGLGNAEAPWGHLMLGTAPIPSAVWLFILPFPLAMLALEELRKAIARRAG